MKKFVKNYLAIGIVLGLSLAFVLSLPLIKDKIVTIPVPVTPMVTVASQTDSFSYQGEAGKDALTILKAKTAIEQESSGLVVSINHRKADKKKHEFWAFYVNKKFASVGPAEYQTKDSDTILWKIEKY